MTKASERKIEKANQKTAFKLGSVIGKIASGRKPAKKRKAA